MGRHSDIQRHNARRREQRHIFPTPVVIAVAAILFIPQVAVHRCPAIAGFLAEQVSRLLISFRRRDIGDSAFQLEQEGVQVDRDKLRGANAGQSARFAQPAGGVIPAGGRPCTQIAIHLIGWSTGMAGRLHVLNPRFVARSVTVIPVAVQQ